MATCMLAIEGSRNEYIGPVPPHLVGAFKVVAPARALEACSGAVVGVASHIDDHLTGEPQNAYIAQGNFPVVTCFIHIYTFYTHGIRKAFSSNSFHPSPLSPNDGVGARQSSESDAPGCATGCTPSPGPCTGTQGPRRSAASRGDRPPVSSPCCIGSSTRRGGRC